MSRPRIGFVGTGWIGRHRMEAMIATGAIDPVAIVEPDPHCAAEAQALAPSAVRVGTLAELLALAPDGVVIATPSAMHARQSIDALEAGAAVFCQKPLGRNAHEAAAVVDAARRADRLLGVDMSYRYTAAAEAIAPIVRSGELGTIFSADLVFHNAYGPDKPWFHDRALSGGGCLIDLGVHLVDLAFWLLGETRISRICTAMMRHGKAMVSGSAEVEDFVATQFRLGENALVRLACSWNLPAGRDAVIEATFRGTEGAVALRNIDGSFYDFVAERYRGTACARLSDPGAPWGGRAAASWAEQLVRSPRFRPEVDDCVAVSRALDAIYDAAG